MHEQGSSVVARPSFSLTKDALMKNMIKLQTLVPLVPNIIGKSDDGTALLLSPVGHQFSAMPESALWKRLPATHPYTQEGARHRVCITPALQLLLPLMTEKGKPFINCSFTHFLLPGVSERLGLCGYNATNNLSWCSSPCAEQNF